MTPVQRGHPSQRTLLANHFADTTKSIARVVTVPVLVNVFGAPNEKPLEEESAGVPNVKEGAVVFPAAPNNPVPVILFSPVTLIKICRHVFTYGYDKGSLRTGALSGGGAKL